MSSTHRTGSMRYVIDPHTATRFVQHLLADLRHAASKKHISDSGMSPTVELHKKSYAELNAFDISEMNKWLAFQDNPGVRDAYNETIGNRRFFGEGTTVYTITTDDFSRSYDNAQEVSQLFSRKPTLKDVLEVNPFVRITIGEGNSFAQAEILPGHQIFIDPRIVHETAQLYLAQQSDRHTTLFDYLVLDVGLDELVAQYIVQSDMLGVVENKTPSHNTGLHVMNKYGERLFLKVHSASSLLSAKQRAHIEAHANYAYGRNKNLHHLVAGTPSSEIVCIGDVAISAQYDISHSLPPGNLAHWLDGYARIATFGTSITDTISLPASTPKSIDFYKESIGTRLPKHVWDSLRCRYEEGIAALRGDEVVLSDTKKANRFGSKFVDLERLQYGSFALPLAMFCAGQGFDADTKKRAIIYLDTRLREYGHNGIDVQQLSTDVDTAMVPVLLRELRGLENRVMTPYECKTRDIFVSYLTTLN